MDVLIDQCLDCLSSTVLTNSDYREAFSRPFMSAKVSDSSLRDLGESLAIDTHELENKAKNVIRRLLTAIHKHSGCPIDRFCVTGSISHQPDNAYDSFGFDITVFVDCKLSHGQVEHGESEHAECSIQSADKIYAALQGIVSGARFDHFGMHFDLEGYGFHVAVTPSFAHKMHLQRKAVWDLIEARDKMNRLTQSDLEKFSLSLHESLGSFMHMGDPVYSDLIRLSRLWRQTVLLAEGCEELSALAVVLIMTRCIDDEKARGMTVTSPSGRGLGIHPFPVQSVFTAFLEALGELETLKISYQRFYEPDLVPERHLAKTPLLLDPVNPWRNVIHSLSREGMQRITTIAQSALKTLQSPDATLADLFRIPMKTRGG